MELLQSIFRKLKKKNHLILTPNKKLKSFIFDEFNSYLFQNLKTISKDDFLGIYHINDWIESLWNELLEREKIINKIFISSFQSQLLWEKIITNSKFYDGLLRVDSTAKLVMQAWLYHKQWRIQLNYSKFIAKDNIDLEAFYFWVDEYKKICNNNNWVDFVDIIDIVIEAFKSSILCAPKVISLVEFSEQNPQYNELFQVLVQKNVDVKCENISKYCDNNCRIELSDIKTEIKIAANWAKLQVTKYDSSSVALIVPDLEKHRDLVVREFNKVFKEDEYDVAAPLKMSQYPLIDMAIAILELSKENIDFNLLSYVLRSNFINFNSISKFNFNNLNRSSLSSSVNLKSKYRIASLKLIEFELYLRSFKVVNFTWAQLLLKIEIFVSKKLNKSLKADLQNIQNIQEIQKDSKNSLENQISIDVEETERLYEFEEFYQYFEIYKNKIKNEKLKLSEWLDIFKTIWQLFGWPNSNLSIDCNNVVFNESINSNGYSNECNHCNNFNDYNDCNDEHKSQEALLKGWDELLDQYVSVSNVIKEAVTFSKAFSILKKLTQNILFLPQIKNNVRVHVLGVLESRGVVFDAIWVSGLSNDAWPMEPDPNPFIPLSLQIKHNLPRSSAQRELALAKDLTDTFKKSGRFEVVFSYPKFSDDVEVLPTNLIVDLEQKELDQIFSDKNLISDLQSINNLSLNIDLMKNKNNLETIIDNNGPPLYLHSKCTKNNKSISKDEVNTVNNCENFSNVDNIDNKELINSFVGINCLDKTNSLNSIDTQVNFYKNLEDKSHHILNCNKLIKNEMNSGSKILHLQAHCPFRAFCEVRLKAYKLDRPSIVINKAQRGEIVHEALALFWIKVGDLDSFNKLDSKMLENILVNIINEVLNNWQKKRAINLQKRYVELEKKRLLSILLDWLNFERKREFFEVVHIEKKTNISIGPLSFKLRLDRVDKLNDHSFVLIDYKTTSNLEINNWFGPRMTEPQLPLYAITSNINFTSIAFGIIKPELQRFKGLSKIDGILPNVTTIVKHDKESSEKLWTEQINLWKESLEYLAKEFQLGVANVCPKNSVISCRYCDFLPICRFGSI